MAKWMNEVQAARQQGVLLATEELLPQIERLQAQLAAQAEVIEAARIFAKMAWEGGSTKDWDVTHDALEAALACLDVERAVAAGIVLPRAKDA